MTTKLRAFVLALAIVFTFNSRHSQAAVGLVTANPAVVTVGLVMAVGGGAALAIAEYKTRRGDLGQVFIAVLVAMGAIAVGGVGLIVLDGEQAYSFAELSADNAEKLGVSEAERLSFNAELDQANALAGFVDSELSQIKNPTAEQSEALWLSVSDAVAPETLKAMQKVSLQLLK